VLNDFFRQEISKYKISEFSPLGEKIVRSFLNDATLEDYIDIIPMRY